MHRPSLNRLAHRLGLVAPRGAGWRYRVAPPVLLAAPAVAGWLMFEQAGLVAGAIVGGLMSGGWLWRLEDRLERWWTEDFDRTGPLG